MANKPSLGALWTGSDARPALWLAVGVLLVAGGLMTARSVAAQEITPDTTVLRTADDLQSLVGPIALYPDDLVGIVLPASTYPLQIVQAARFLEQRKIDGALTPDESWDDSVVALLNYPEVVKLLNDDLDWTWDLGQAVLNQNTDVLNAIQTFRDRAYAAGNLKTDDRQVVTAANEEITIAPADPEVIYVPYYEPARVVVYQPRPVYYYYPWAYPVYYYPYPVGYSFHTGFFWGVSTAFVVGWHTHHVHVYRSGFAGHPYYGHRYYDNYYVRNNTHVNVNVVNYNGGHVWEPRHRNYGGRPFTRSDEGYAADRRGGSATPGQTGGATRSSGGYTRSSTTGNAGNTRPTGGGAGDTTREQAAANYRNATRAAGNAGTANGNGQNPVTRTAPQPGAAASNGQRPAQQPSRTSTYRAPGSRPTSDDVSRALARPQSPRATAPTTQRPGRTTGSSAGSGAPAASNGSAARPPQAAAPSAGAAEARTYRSGADPRVQRSVERAPSSGTRDSAITRHQTQAAESPRAAPARQQQQNAGGGEQRSSQGSSRSQQGYRGGEGRAHGR
jgi:uncharacterized protein DUF3300